MESLTRGARRYGWRPDPPDGRDFVFAAAPRAMAALPPKVDLRHQCPPVFDQGQLQSFTANAIAAALQFDELRQGRPAAPALSRLFIYYYERWMEHAETADAGAAIRDGIKVAAKVGVPPERLWPYDPVKVFTEPSQAAADAATLHALAYHRLNQTLAQLKGCLAEGRPFVFGFTVYSRFEGPEVEASGSVDLPRADEKIAGRHAVLAVGYDEPAQRFIVRNSWGAGWGQEGYFTMPFAYLLQNTLARDFWVIQSTT